MRASKLPFLFGLTLAFGCGGGSEPPTEYPDAVAADPDHYTVEFENDAVRLLRIDYGPGETSVMHSHPPSCSIALGDAAWSMTDPDGNVTEDSAAFGEVECVEAGVHLPEISSGAPAELLLVELKEGATAGTAPGAEEPEAVTADPDHYSVVFENDAVRLLRIDYGPGETSVMHSHPASCAIFLGDQAVTFELPGGEVEDAPAGGVGVVNCVDAGVHRPTNTGTGDLQVVLVEFKGRATVQG